MYRDLPNVVVCLCDQLRAFEAGCYGNPTVQTPHIDAMASEGVRFETACSNCPLCTPARSSLLTGQYARTCTGTLVNKADTPPADERVRLVDTTLAESFQAAGGHTALIGKWHIHPHPKRVGFDETLFPDHRHRYTGLEYYGNDERRFEAPGYAPDFEADQVGAFLSRSHDKPFFLFYNISPPHMPVFDAPEKYLRMFAPEEVPLRDNVFDNGEMACDEHWFKIYLYDYLYYRDHLPGKNALPERFDLRHLTALYYGMTAWVDDCVGRLMASLKVNGLDENTLVLFTSDHGDNLGSHQSFNKGQLTDESIRVPFLLRWPGALAPRVLGTQVIALVDAMPTLLGLLGLPVQPSVQGQDLSAAVRGAAPEDPDSCSFIETHHHEIGIRTSTHLVGTRLDASPDFPARPYAERNHRFYDMRSDPYQMNNLAGTGEQAAEAARLGRRLEAWHEQTPWRPVED